MVNNTIITSGYTGNTSHDVSVKERTAGAAKNGFILSRKIMTEIIYTETNERSVLTGGTSSFTIPHSEKKKQPLQRNATQLTLTLLALQKVSSSFVRRSLIVALSSSSRGQLRHARDATTLSAAQFVSVHTCIDRHGARARVGGQVRNTVT